jgi:ATP-dependent Clp protease protease subunit
MGAGFRVAAKAGQPKTGEVYIYEDVGASWFGGVSAKDFALALAGLGAVDQIDVRINSYGGDVFEGLAMYRNLVDHPAHVTTYIDGIAASIASVIAMAGNEIFIAEAGQIMIHNAWMVTLGDDQEHMTNAQRLKVISASIADIYVARTGQPVDKVASWMREETDMTAQVAVERGFAGEIMPNLRAAAFVRQQPSKTRWSARRRGGADDSIVVARPLLDAATDKTRRMRARLLLATA